ncbi:MAG: thioredoxin TrxC [Xanthomonadales bacterium]|nr:thioredoxin TrxC [Xanthomonadales bacterium]
MTFSRKVSCPYCGAADRVPAERWSDELECSQCGRALFASRPLELTEQDFDEQVGAGELPVLVDFWASWCGPCKAMAPAFEKAAQTLESRVRFAKLNTDDAQSVAQKYGIRSIPTMILFQGGQEVARHSGAMMAGDIEQWVDDQLAEPAA